MYIESVKEEAMPSLTTLTNGVMYRIREHIVEVFVDKEPMTLNVGANVLATLPAEARPSRNITLAAATVPANIAKINVFINANGNVGISNSSGAQMSSGGYITAHETYLV